MKFKDYLLYTLSTIGILTLFISATTTPINQVGTFQITMATDGGIPYNCECSIGQEDSAMKGKGEQKQKQT